MAVSAHGAGKCPRTPATSRTFSPSTPQRSTSLCRIGESRPRPPPPRVRHSRPAHRENPDAHLVRPWRGPRPPSGPGQITLDQGIVNRPLKVLTFHAKDVYPQLFRSTLLIRLVAAYEAFLVDTIGEISRRSDEPFASDKGNRFVAATPRRASMSSLYTSQGCPRSQHVVQAEP
jgi:hypothetical protein